VALLSADFKAVIYKENRDDWRREEIVVTTVQSLLSNNKYQRLFSPTDFDLVISDEAHRSIGGNARAVFDYFIGYKLGGIKPHNRFSVQSKRSEALFVDYMAEHLTPGGRAGIIVPEGIIVQSQNAYMQLRKMLVEEYLVAVVSLPSGVFNPYSGVKTSILILDKSLAKNSGTIAFFRIENDGFGLGAQRREIDKNDLPQARAEVVEYLRRLRAGESVTDFQPKFGLIVEKEKVAANGECTLSGERYGSAG
jgi:N-6 DNA Methylase/Type III restriction enzyme, res subunit